MRKHERAGAKPRANHVNASPQDLSLHDLSVRQVWMDAFRGSAILLVILFHLLMLFREDLDGHPVYAFLSVITKAVGPFRMEALYFLSGMLVSRSITKAWGPYISRKIDTILWPYIIWTAVILLVEYRTDSYSPLAALYGFSHLTWFLAFLFLYCAVSYVLKSWNFRILLALAYGLSITFFLTGSPLDRGFVNLWDLPYYYLYFVCGHQFAKSPGAVGASQTNAVLVTGWVAAMAVIVAAILVNPPNTHPGYFPFVITSFPFLLWAFSRMWMERFFVYIGRKSIYFFVMHFPIVVLCKRHLVPLLPSALAGFAVAAAFAIGLPVVTKFLADRSAFVKAFFVRPAALRPRSSR